MSRKGDRIILVKLVLGGNIINIISVYAPQVGLDEHIKTQFWENMDELMRGIPQGEHVFIGGDFNGHVGKDYRGYQMVHGSHGFGDRNDPGEAILDFAVAYDLIVANTFFRKRDEHLITFKSGPNVSQIDFFLMKRIDRLTCKDCKVIPGESITLQHRLLVLDMAMKKQLRKMRDIKSSKIRWWNLKGEKVEMFREKMLKEAI